MTLTEQEMRRLVEFKKDFGYLVAMKDELTIEFQNITAGLRLEVDRLALGTCGVYLISILNNLRGVELTLEHGFIESGAAVAASLWEKCITLAFILNNPNSRSLEHSSHRGFKRKPWGIKQMVKDIVNNQELPASRNRKIEEELLYFQYSYLCAIKHGNPFTLVSLNRVKADAKRVIDVQSEIWEDDKGLVAWLFGISISLSTDTLVAFAKVFGESTTYQRLAVIQNRFASTLMAERNNRKFKFPNIILSASSDFSDEFLNYVKKVNKRYFKDDNDFFT